MPRIVLRDWMIARSPELDGPACADGVAIAADKSYVP